jgi:nitronate monooxygenase
VARLSPHDLELPIVGAPLGGGPSTPALAAAIGDAGGLGFLAAGYRGLEEVRADVAALRALTAQPFGLNVFAPPGPPGDPAAIAGYAARLCDAGLEVGEARHHDDGYAAKLALAAELAVPVVSVSFGCPAPGEVAALQAAGCAVWVTVTTPEEAEAAAAAGADALVVQGVEAGGHRGGFDDAAPGDTGLLALLALVGARVDTPLVATGGIATGGAVAAVLAAGAAAAQLGSALLLADEAATAPAHRAALAAPGRTRLTRAFTGRTARGIANRFLTDHDAAAPAGYPEVHHLTAPARGAARAAGDAGGFHLWAGQAHELARPGPAGDIVRGLAAEARAALVAAAARLEA